MIKNISKFLILVVLLSCVPQKIPSFVSDVNQILTPAQDQALDMLYREHEKTTTNEIALCITYDHYPEDELRGYGLKLAQNIGVGKKKKNNGLFILFCYKCKRVEIYTGSNMANILKDDMTKSIIDTAMIPFFKQGEFYTGLMCGSKAIIAFLERPENKIN